MYCYSRFLDETIEVRKARCSVRGDLMIPLTHIDSVHVASYLVDKSIFHLILDMSCSLHRKVQKFDIEAAYTAEVHENQNIFVNQMPM